MIEFKRVEKRYPNGLLALNQINLQIEQGEFVAIIGLSGAGKSTLLRCINKMHDITGGTLHVNHVNVHQLKGKSIRQLRRNIGMIFQSFNLVTRVSVLKNVLVSFVPNMPVWRKILGIFTKEEKRRALMALDQVGILDKAYVRVDQLSGGQQQRVALARTLAQNPQIILADEPVASLDPVTAKQVMEDFKRINQELNMTILINIHHVDLALAYATRVIGVRSGEIVFDGQADEINEETLAFIYHNTNQERGVTKYAMEAAITEKIVLPNGKEVLEKRSFIPGVWLILFILTVLAIRITGFSLDILVNRIQQFFVILQQMIPPNWGYLSKLWQPLFDTIKMSLFGSIAGALCALPIAILAATNITKQKGLAMMCKFILSLLRTLPTLIIALIATFIFGLGTMAGTVAIFLFTIAYVGKLLYEQIENANMEAYEAMQSMGLTTMQAFRYAILPQILPNYLSTSLFCFEGNVRYASILGYVGAGGIGLLLNESLGWRSYENVGMILLMLVCTVFLIETTSEYFRKKLM